jgi:hypothetical protein
MHNEEQWVIWNGFFGILDSVTIGEVKAGVNGRQAWLDEPYDMVGPFSLDALEANGQISFAACLVMSRQKWQEDQVSLRREAHKKRRAAQEQLFEEQARASSGHQHQQSDSHQVNEQQYRQSLNLPVNGKLEVAQIKTAYRRLAQKAHPDAGGSHEQFVQITRARDALLQRASAERWA